MIDTKAYRESEAEQQRLRDLLRLLPRGQRTILEIGARDGYHTRILTELFETVTALDLEQPAIVHDRVIPVKGNVLDLEFPDNAFDCVLCAEVLEHIPRVSRAAAEISRVAARTVVIGVPYKQDTRAGRTTCARCGRTNPPYGHINTFDEHHLKTLFPALRLAETSYVGSRRERTNAISAWLMDLAGNPWGTYGQEESCTACGAPLEAPSRRSGPRRICSRLAFLLNQAQRPFITPVANWIHMRFVKEKNA